MQNASSITRDSKTGEIVSTTACTQPHPLGHQARDPLGRPYAGAYKGQWEPNSPDAPSNPASRTALIMLAIGSVDLSKAKNRTENGKPKVEAIETVLGEQISYQVRDLVWRHMQAPTAEAVAPTRVVEQAAGIDSRQSIIEGAIRRLDRDNKDLWMPKGGKPKIEAIEQLIGGDVSSAERDAAWHIVSQE